MICLRRSVRGEERIEWKTDRMIKVTMEQKLTSAATRERRSSRAISAPISMDMILSDSVNMVSCILDEVMRGDE